MGDEVFERYDIHESVYTCWFSKNYSLMGLCLIRNTLGLQESHQSSDTDGGRCNSDFLKELEAENR